jgi:hypothetical protein
MLPNTMKVLLVLSGIPAGKDFPDHDRLQIDVFDIRSSI